MSQANTNLGGFTNYSTEVSTEAQAVFKEAMHEILGSEYTPIAVASQVVNGTNYRFFCNYRIIAPNAINEGVFVSIFDPSSSAEKARVTDTQKVPYEEVV